MASTLVNRALYPSPRGKRVLVPGGASGIGAGLVEAFAAQGAHVLFCDIAADAAEALLARLGPGAAAAPLFRRCDLTDVEAVRALVAETEAALGGLDVLVNNAGNDDRHRLDEVTPEYWDERIAVNLRHLFFAAQAAVPAMRRAGGGVILNFGSISWHLGLKDLAIYQTAKAGIEGMSRALARFSAATGSGWSRSCRAMFRPRGRRSDTRPRARRRSSRRSAWTAGSSQPTSPPWPCSWPRTTRGCAPGTATSWMPAGAERSRF